jgi:flagellar motor switch protein FliN/FliY
MSEQPPPQGTPEQPNPAPPNPSPSSPEPTAQAAQPDPAPAQPPPPAEATAAPETPAPETPAPAAPVAETIAAAPAEVQPAADDAIDQESIDALLKQANFDSPDANAAGAAGGPSIEELLQQANFDDASGAAGELPGSEASGFKLPSFQQVMADAQVSSIDLLRDVELNVKIELGRSRMLVEEVLQLNEGSVVELDKLAGDPVDVFVNDRLVARGEVLVLNDNFCVRVNEIVPAAQEEAM